MSHLQTRLRMTVALAVIAAALAACGNNAPPASSNTPSAMRDVVDEAAKDAVRTGALPAGDAPLKDGQSVQGTIEADVGNGVQTFRSIATRVADDIGAQADKALGAGKGQRAIDDANRKLEKLGVDTRVSVDDVRDLVGSMAGRTFHDSEVRRIDIIRSLQVTLKGAAADGGNLDLGLTFDDRTLDLTGASLSYRPKANAVFDTYQSKGKDNVEATIDRFERNADGSYAIAGTFMARDVPASKMAKKLPANSLPLVSGRFSFDALPLKDMSTSGR